MCISLGLFKDWILHNVRVLKAKCWRIVFLEHKKSACKFLKAQDHQTKLLRYCDGSSFEEIDRNKSMSRCSISFHQLFFLKRHSKHPWLGLTCLGRIGFNSSTLLLFIFVFISCRCWRTALSFGPIQVVSLLGFRTVGTSLAASSGTASRSIASSEIEKHGFIRD